MPKNGSAEKCAVSSAKIKKREFVDFDSIRKSGRRAVFDRIRIITQNMRR